MRKKRAREIKEKTKLAAGGVVKSGTMRNAKKDYTSQGFFDSQNPKLKQTKRQARLSKAN